MATSKKKQLEKERDAQFGKISKGQKKAEEKEAYADDEIVVIETRNEIKPFLRFHLFHSFKTKKWTYYLSSLICLLGCVMYYIYDRMDLVILFGVLAVVFPLLMVGLTLISAKSQLKKDQEFLDTDHTYIFKEDEFIGRSRYGKKDAKFVQKYSEMLFSFDKGDFAYIYISKDNAFVIEKSNFKKGNKELLEFYLKKIPGYDKAKIQKTKSETVINKKLK